MTDWERLLRNKARSGTFVGRGAADEDAYYATFSGEEPEPRGEKLRLSEPFSLWLKVLRAPARP